MTEPPTTDWQPERDLHKTAVDLVVSEGASTWARFNAMLVAHTILLVACGALLFGEGMRVPSYVPMVLAVAGLVVSFAWSAAVSRGVRYQLRYVDFAKALEAKFPSDEFKILTDGAKTHMCFPATVPTRTTQHIVIWVFMALYLAALGQAIYAALVCP
jgi:hypothetical protein